MILDIRDVKDQIMPGTKRTSRRTLHSLWRSILFMVSSVFLSGTAAIAALAVEGRSEALWAVVMGVLSKSESRKHSSIPTRRE